MRMISKQKLRSTILPRSLRRLLTRMPLRWALTVPFVLLTVGATTLVGYLSYRNGEQTVSDLAGQLMQEKGDQTVLYLEKTLEVPHLINQLNADSIRLGQLPGFETTNPEPLEKFFWAQLLRFPNVTTIAIANERGGMIGSGRVYQPRSFTVYRTQQFARGIYSTTIRDAQGNITETTITAQTYDARTRPWYQTPAQAGKATWSPIYKYISRQGSLGISAGLPIYTSSGKLRGVLATDITLNKLSQFLSNLQISPSGQMFIVERSGLLVASSTNQPFVRVKAGKAERINAGESENLTMRATMAQVNARFGDLTRIGATQQFTFQQLKSAKWVRVVPFQDQYGLDWLIVIVVPESDFMGAIHANQATTLLLCLLTLCSASGLGLLAASRLTTRFAQLNQASRELAVGNLDQRLLTNGSIVELNGLAHTFNQMADQIQDSFDRIKIALEESKEKFTVIFRSSPESAVITSLSEGRFLEVNDSFLQFFGYSQDEVIGRTAQELQIWGDLAQRKQYRALLAQQGSVQNLEVQVRTKSGEIKTVLLSAEVRTLEGQDRLLVMQRDITDRKTIELALQQSEARYRAIIEDQTELICRWQPDQSRTFVNDAYCRYFGVRREDIIGKSYQQFIYESDQAKVSQLINSMSITNPTITIENRVVVNGEVRWMQWIDRLLFDAQGNVIEFQAVGRDITELKQTEEALRKSETSLLQAQQIAHLGSWEFDLATQKLSWSEELFRIIGLDSTRTEPSRTELMTMIPQADRDVLESAVERAIAQGTSYEVEHRIVRRDGLIRYVVSKGQVAYDDQQLVKLYGTVLDITERKQVEAALQSQAEEEHLLTTITQNIRRSLDLEQILSTTVAEVQQTLNADRALIFRLNHNGLGQIIQEAVASDYPVTDQMRWEDEHFPEDCYEYYRQGTPRIVPDVATDEWAACLAEFMQAVGVKSKVIAPIVQGTGTSVPTVWGLLIVHACSDYREWQESEADFLQKICNQLAIAIDQANLYQQLQTELAERKQTEKVLQEREAMLRAIGDNLPKGFIYQRVYESGKGSYYSYISAGIERLLNLKPEAVIENPALMRTVGFDEDLAIADRMVQESLKNLTPIELQMRNRTPQGKIQWSSIRSVPRRLEDGRVVWDGVEIDITNLKQIETALRESEERFRRAFDDAPIGISLVSATGQFVKANRSYCNLLGYTTEELFALNFRDISHPEDGEMDWQGFQQMLSGEIGSFQMQKRYITKQGTIVPVLLNAAPIRDEAGEVLYVVGHVQDIRDRLAVERIKDEFISVVSHELRTPLTSIRGALGILGSGVFAIDPSRQSRCSKLPSTTAIVWCASSTTSSPWNGFSRAKLPS